jgi:protein-tyrosine kinase
VKGGAMTAKGWLKQWLSSPAPVEDDPLAAEAERIDRYLGMMEIVPTQKTQLVKVVFSTPDRQLSARMANAHAQAYIRHGLERRTQANEEAQTFLEGKLGELKTRVDQSEAALNRYRQVKDAISLNDKETLMVMEAYRTLRTAILLSRAEKPPQTLLFTSAMHGEGKTVTTVNTAIVLAQMGARVLLIDADLRCSRCHELLGVQRRQGMTDILTGRREPHELLQSTSIPELFFLSSGSTPPNPTDLVGSKKMQDTLITLSERYDYILLDSPPVMAVSDAVLLSTMAEGVILVINVQATPKHLLREARARLHYARAKMLGTVLNRAELRAGAYAYY